MTANKKKRKRGLGDVLSTLLLLIALAVFCYAGYRLYHIYMDYKTGVDEYKELDEFFVLEEPVLPEQKETGSSKETKADVSTPETEEETVSEDEGKASGQAKEQEAETEIETETETEPAEIYGPFLPKMENPVDFESLCSINEDVIGWLHMESVDISYPLVQGMDNDYYLHRTFQRTDNFAGSIFMDFINSRDFSDENSILYGHYMKNGSMFGILNHYKDFGKYQESPYFWIYTPRYIYKYQIFSCSEVPTGGDAYMVSFANSNAFQEYIYRMIDGAFYDTGVEVTAADKLVTLSTCTGYDETRFIVQGKRVEIYQAVPKSEAEDSTETETEEQEGAHD